MTIDFFFFSFLAEKTRVKIGFKSVLKVKVNMLRKLRTVLADIFYSEIDSL